MKVQCYRPILFIYNIDTKNLISSGKHVKIAENGHISILAQLLIDLKLFPSYEPRSMQKKR